MTKRDENNARLHGDKNKAAIRDALRELGAGRSIVLDNEEYVIAGNQTLAEAEALGIPVRVIEVDGSELIALKRTDVAPGTAERDALALADNRTAEVDTSWDPAVLEAMIPRIEETLPGLAEGWEFPELSGIAVQPFGETSTDRNGQGVSSTWQSCRDSKYVQVKIGTLETVISEELAEQLQEYCRVHYEKFQRPVSESFEAVIKCGLQS